MSGSIRQRGPTSWEIRVSLGERDSNTGRYLYAERTVRGGKRDAQRALTALALEVQKGGHRQTQRRTVSDLLEQWMTHIEGQGRARSRLVRYRSAIDANIVPELGTRGVTKLGGSDLDAFYSKLRKRGLSPLSIRKCHAVLSAALSQAMRWGWVDRNPVLQAHFSIWWGVGVT